MWGTFPEEVTLTRLMLAQSSNMVRPQGPCARFPMEVAAFPGRGDGLELQIGISPATEKPGPEVLRLVPTHLRDSRPSSANVPTGPTRGSMCDSGTRCKRVQRWKDIRGWRIDPLILMVTPSYGQLCAPPQGSRGFWQRVPLSFSTVWRQVDFSLSGLCVPICETVITTLPHSLRESVG